MSGGLLLRPHHLLLLCLTIVSLISSSECDELQLLLNFKSALEKSDSGVFSSWTEKNSVCNFTGVVCNAFGFVTEINLSRQQLSGVLPFDSICGLQSLEKLDLGMNSLNGTITQELRNCKRLKYLDLGVNSFSGEVPDLSSLGDLEFLDLNNSGFSGKFPWKSLEILTSLAFLSLGDNPFDETPFPEEVIRLEKLYWLYLSNCSISGQIPEGIGNLTQLQNLELSDNQLSGHIPEGIGRLNKLWQLELYNNSLTGKLPVGLRNLTGLVYFDASTNDLEGDLSEVRFLTELASLQLFENHFTGEIPEELGEFMNLVELSFYKNKLTGPIPLKLGSWADFVYIDVSENFLTGPIPPDMCKKGKMTDLLLLQNELTGTIPDTYGNCSSLVRLRLGNNSLSGTVPPGIWSLPNLLILDVVSNQFDGPITSDIGRAMSLAQLFLAQNKFSGNLPAELVEVKSLVSIQLSFNNFGGKIPTNIGNLKKLGSLYLDGNSFSGTIPSSMGYSLSLTDVNLSNNSLSGEIPESLGELPTLNSLNLSNNKLSGEIPGTLSSLELSLLDLSNNHLSGRIPDSLTIQAYSSSFDGNSGLCSERFKQFQPCFSGSGASNQLRTILSCFLGGTVLLMISVGCCLFMKFQQKAATPVLKTEDSWNMKTYHVLSFSEREIIDAIKTENLIGKGGSGNVYKAILRNGEVVAVKHIWALDSSSSSSKTSSTMLTRENTRSREFDAEVSSLSSIRHVNVVKLFCSITSEDSNLLVYEYLPNGSLWEKLHSTRNTDVDWRVRYEIAVGAARGLEYLHHGCERPIIHRDVKSSNILLDSEWKPRIADFGLSKIIQVGNGGSWTKAIAGTHGYIAPEYAYTCKISEKSDVYSFGVVLMELVTGRRPTESEFGESKDLVSWAHSKMINDECELDEVVDPSISCAMKMEAIKVMRIAVHCTAKFPVLRPSMRMVVQMLEEAEPCRLSSIVVNREGERNPSS